jgi:hypothetical protein
MREETIEVRKALLVVTAMLGVALSGFVPVLAAQTTNAPSQKADGPSPSDAIERDIAARKKALLSQKEDLTEMAKSLSGTEFRVESVLDQSAGQGLMELDATLWFLGVYDNMHCDQDREIAKTALKNRLAFYSHMLGLAADQTAGELAFTKSPAIAQAGQRLKDDLRAARDKLDEINASLR